MRIKLTFNNNTASTADNKVHVRLGRSVPEVDFLLCAGFYIGGYYES
jgi:hypothetical protein